jgi:hypothetical protein
MDGVTLQNRVYKGYAKAAQYIGLAYTLYRPASAINPLAISNTFAILNASFNAEDMAYSKPNKYGKATWYGLFDGTGTKVGDYMVGQAGTFFIASQQALLPIFCVECNRTLTVYKPGQPVGVGAVGYGGDTAATETVIMTAWPASVLEGTKGEKTQAELPGDVKNPWWIVLMPAYPGVIIKTGYYMTDEIGNRYVVASPELTDAGWRMRAMQAAT